VIPGILPGWQRAGKSGKRHYTQARTANAQAEIAAWAWQAAQGRVLSGALAVDILSGRPVPKTAVAHLKIGSRAILLKDCPPAVGRVDVDNIAKGALDALNGVLWKDDAQVADLRVRKVYTDCPRTEITVWELPPESPDKFFGAG
jgi:Holliday junction resolvase RusA-like endonuclease